MRQEKVYYWLLQFSGWGAFHFLVAANAYGQGKLSNKYLIVILLLFTMAIMVSHSIREVFIRFKWLEFSIYKITPRVLTIGLLGAAIIYFSQFISGSWYYNNIVQLINKPLIDHFTSILSWWVMLTIWCAVYLAYHLFNKSKKEEIENLQLKATQNEIELNQLRAQMNPHFIFNSLNSIRALITENQEDAKKAITQLSKILRSSLHSGKEKTISMEEEIATVEAYLHLEKIRFEERLQFKVNFPEEVKTFPVPPLMIQTIVENAVKHGISKITKGGFIEISISKEENNVVILVENSGKMDPDRLSDDTQGIGISNTQKRLEILFGDQYIWKLEQKKDSVLATVRYPIKPNKK